MNATFDLETYRKSLSFHLNEEKLALDYWQDHFKNNYTDEGLRYLWQPAEAINKSVGRVKLIVFLQEHLSRYADQSTLEGVDAFIPMTVLAGAAITDHNQVDKDFYNALVETTAGRIYPFMPPIVL